MKPESYLPMKVVIELEYDALVFEGDPDDKFDLAELEETAVAPELQAVIDNILDNVSNFKVTVKPV